MLLMVTVRFTSTTSAFPWKIWYSAPVEALKLSRVVLVLAVFTTA